MLKASPANVFPLSIETAGSRWLDQPKHYTNGNIYGQGRSPAFMRIIALSLGGLGSRSVVVDPTNPEPSIYTSALWLPESLLKGTVNYFNRHMRTPQPHVPSTADGIAVYSSNCHHAAMHILGAPAPSLSAANEAVATALASAAGAPLSPFLLPLRPPDRHIVIADGDGAPLHSMILSDADPATGDQYLLHGATACGAAMAVNHVADTEGVVHDVARVNGVAPEDCRLYALPAMGVASAQ